jgi:MFS family permease
MRQRDLLVLVLFTLVIGVVHQFYFTWNSPFLKAVLSGEGIGAWEQRVSSLGQIGEIVVMAVLAPLVVRWGFKRVMVLGTLAYLARCLILAGAYQLDATFAVKMSIICLGQLLHGVCFGCFLAVAFMYIDRVAPPHVRGSAQNLYGTLILGLGFFVGGLVSGKIGEWFEIGKQGDVIIYDWTNVWLASAAIAAVGVLGFAALFPSDRRG